MGAPVTHFEIISRNGEDLKEFYAKLFGWKINSANPMNYGLVQAEGRGIGGGISSPGPDGMTHVTIYAVVPDPQVTIDLAVNMGATVVLPPTEIPGMVTYALFTDPDGNRIGIVKDQPMPEQSSPKKERKASKPRRIPKRKPSAKKKKKPSRKR